MIENVRIPAPEEIERNKQLHPERYCDKPYPEGIEDCLKCPSCREESLCEDTKEFVCPVCGWTAT